MKHIINIAFDFDDQKVKETLEATVEEEVKKDIRQAVIDGILEKPTSYSYGYGSSPSKVSHATIGKDPLQGWVINYVKEYLATPEVKETIWKLAGKEMAASMLKSPKYKELIFEEFKHALECGNVNVDMYYPDRVIDNIIYTAEKNDEVTE